MQRLHPVVLAVLGRVLRVLPRPHFREVQVDRVLAVALHDVLAPVLVVPLLAALLVPHREYNLLINIDNCSPLIVI